MSPSPETALTLFGDTVVVRSLEAPVVKKPTEEYGDKKPFRMTDMLFVGDKKRLWLEYRTLLSDGYAVDALFPIMWWGVKSVLHTKCGVSGVNPFVSGKINKGLIKTTNTQAIDIALSFLEMVVYTRTVPRVTAESAFEQWILELPV